MEEVKEVQIVLSWLDSFGNTNGGDFAQMTIRLIEWYGEQVKALRAVNRAHRDLVGALYHTIDVLEKENNDGNQ